MAAMTAVLHLVWEYPPIIYGGLARHAEELAQAQYRAGHNVSVVTAAEDVLRAQRRVPAAFSVRDGVRIRRARRPAPRRPWSDLLGAAAELDRAMTAAALDEVAVQPPDIVHAHDWTAFRAGRAVATVRGLPFVVTVHATEYGRRLGRLEAADGIPSAVHAVERAGVAEADAVVVCSAAMRAEVCDVLGADPAKVVVVPNAVDPAAWRCAPAVVRAARRRWIEQVDVSGPVTAPAPDAVLIAAAGRLEWDKGFSTLVRALPALRVACGTVCAVLAGRGSDAPRLRDLAQELEVTDILRIPGWLERRELAALYAAADVVVVPSRYEPSGLVAREAQAAGTVVIATDSGGLPDAVTPGVTGLRIGVGDVDGLRDAVLRLVRAPQEARRMADAGSRAVSGWTWRDAAGAVDRVYQDALHRPTRREPARV